KNFTKGFEYLERIPTDRRGGIIRLMAGSPLNDKRGAIEDNEFSCSCWQIELLLAIPLNKLKKTIDEESKKKIKRGEKPKRLRTLVEALAVLWGEAGGAIAPQVTANRRDGDRAVVHGRHGPFLEFATDLFCRVDAFKPSEVEAAVTNVY